MPRCSPGTATHRQPTTWQEVPRARRAPRRVRNANHSCPRCAPSANPSTPQLLVLHRKPQLGRGNERELAFFLELDGQERNEVPVVDAAVRIRLVEHLSVVKLVLVGVALQGDPHEFIARFFDMKKDTHVVGVIGMAQDGPGRRRPACPRALRPARKTCR